MLKLLCFLITIISIFTIIRGSPFVGILPFKYCSQLECPPKTAMCDSRTEQFNDKPAVEIITCKDARGQILETRKESKKTRIHYFFPQPFFYGRQIFHMPYRFIFRI